MRKMLFDDDHPVYRDGLKRALSEQSPDLQVVVASGLTDAMAMLETAEFDLALSELSDYRRGWPTAPPPDC